MRYEDEKYDVYLYTDGPAPPGVALPFDPALLQKSYAERRANRAPILEGLSLSEAKKWVYLFEKAERVNGRPCARLDIEPTRYRVPKVSREQARGIAQKRWEELVEQGRPLDPLDIPMNDQICWSFGADDRDWQAQGLIPGRVWIYVDKLDGHIVSDEEMNRYYAAKRCD